MRFSVRHLSALFVGAALVGMTSLALANAGSTEIFVRDSTSALRHIEALIRGSVLQAGYTDRSMHFAVSFLLGWLSMHIANLLVGDSWGRARAAILALGIAMIPGFIKEWIDMAQPHNRFSWSDIFFDASGVSSGILFACVLLFLLHRVQRNQIQQVEE